MIQKAIRLASRWIHNLKYRSQFKQLKPSFAIQSHLSIPERVKLYELATGRRRILEIGSYLGASACCFGAAVLNSEGSKIYCVDTWKNDAMTEGNRDTHSEFLANTRSYADSIVAIRGYSTDVVGLIREQSSSLDLIFIDGDHSYHGVRADWYAYKSFLKPGAIVVFHDWGWAAGVQKLIREEVVSQVIDVGELPNLWWGTIATEL